jgi:hypothetical protein
LEEADYLMIGRRDQLSDEEVDGLQSALATLASDVPVIAVSPRTGAGVDEVLGYIESPMVAGHKLLEIDYDTYADGEAELGWVNLSAILRADHEIDLDGLAAELVAAIASEVVDNHDGQIAHLKVSVLGGDAQGVANVVSNDSGVDVGLAANRSVTGSIQTIVNARVAIDPQVLQQACQDSVESIAKGRGLTIESVSSQSLRPGRPVPTHRVT